jgi:hypothetical protein
MAIISAPMGKGSDVRAVAEVLKALPPTARPEDIRAVQKLGNACGCAEGAVGALALSALVLVRFLCAPGEWSLLDLPLLLPQVVAAFLIGGFAGKYVGLAVVRARLRRLCNRIWQEARIRAT